MTSRVRRAERDEIEMRLGAEMLWLWWFTSESQAVTAGGGADPEPLKVCMGYFSNGSEGEYYEAQWCHRCVHQPTAERGCPVWDLHMLYNYDQCKKATTAEALSMFIPRDADGGNGRCTMFFARGSRGGGSPEPLPVPLTIVRAA